MATGNTVKTDLYSIFGYIENAPISYPKDLIIETLRDYFSQDSYYHYSRDPWGFPNTPDHTDLIQMAGLHDDLTTRIFIGETYRNDMVFYPALLVRSGGSRSIPISMNRDKGNLYYTNIAFIDGYGKEQIVSTPSKFVQSGAYEGQVTVEINTRSSRARDELADLVSILFIDARFEELKDAGLVIKATSVGTPSETDDRNNKLFKVTVTFDVRTEWRRELAVENVVDAINLCVEFAAGLDSSGNPTHIAPNLKISTSIELIDALQDI